MDHTKLKELILYIADKCQYWPNFGATMLNKVLFFSDFVAYKMYGESITDEPYIKLQYGPAPKYLLAARDDLIGSGEVVLQERQTIRGSQDRVVPVGRQANLDVFKPSQVALVDEVIDRLKEHDAVSVSGLSHKFYGWQITKTNEVIPYETVFLNEPVELDVPQKVRDKVNALKKKYESG